MSFPSDLDIANSVKPRPIVDVAADLGLRDDEIELYGRTKAKVTLAGSSAWRRERPRGKYVLVTAITPTPLGEGKTTTTVGLAQGLNRIGNKASVAIRQPSLGPVFGIKGGAAGGGYSQIIPMEDFNLHLTGDIHAISAAHNLASAFLDNHLHHGNALGIDPFSIRWPRVVDISDRAIRRAVIGLGGKENGVPREAEWVITVASEVMAILALSTRPVRPARAPGPDRGRHDARGQGRHDRGPRRGRRDDRAPARRHQAEPPPDAGGRAGLRPLRPVRQHRPRQQLDPRRPGRPLHHRHRGHRGRLRRRHGRREVLRHQVPRIGAAAGCGGGGGHGPGAQDARRRRQGRGRQAARCGAHDGERRGRPGRRREPGGARRDRPLLRRPGGRGDQRLPDRHGGRARGDPRDRAGGRRRDAVVTTNWAEGGKGAEALAAAVWKAAEYDGGAFQLLYPDELPLKEKIEPVATRIYGAAGVDYAPAANKALAEYTALGYGHLPVCMAKTHLSLTHDPALKGRPTGYRFPIRDVRLSAGAGFIYPLAGDMRTMPGLPFHPAGEKIDIDENGEVVGLF